MLREPVVAGTFYEDRAHALKSDIEKYTLKKETKDKVIAKAIVVPHAGYIYSGRVAGETISSVVIPENVIILGPNHTGMGSAISVMNTGAWRTPLGDVKINSPLAKEILEHSVSAEADTDAHINEHSIEVQLPFLIEMTRGFSFVPICLAEPDTSKLKDLACAVFEAAKEKEILIVASTDLNHYESAEIEKEKDAYVIEAIRNLDEESLYKSVKEKDISMCGWMPTYTAIYAAKLMGASTAEIVRHTNSGEVNGDHDKVVGYCGAIIL